MNVKLAGGPIDYFALDPVALTFGAVGISVKAPHPNTAQLAANFVLSKECETFLAKFGRIPTRADVESNPPGIVQALSQKKVITVSAVAAGRAQVAAEVQRLVRGAVMITSPRVRGERRRPADAVLSAKERRCGASAMGA